MDVSAIARKGLQHADAKLQQAAAKIASFGTTTANGIGPDTVNLSAAMIALMSAKNQAAANLKTLKTDDELWKTTIDLMA